MNPTVVVVGAGFGGLRAARALRRAPVEVVLVDRHNYHLFQPLLYQVATAGLEPEQIARPVRAILRRQRNADFRLVEVTGLDLGRRELATDAGPLRYDYLVLAAGAGSRPTRGRSPTTTSCLPWAARPTFSGSTPCAATASP